MARWAINFDMSRFFQTAAIRFLAFLAISSLLLRPSFAETTSSDVIVYGSTPSGVCAAIAAAREGASVLLIEPTDHIGGLNTGGLSFSDSNQMHRKTLMGLFDEWHTGIAKDYTDRGLKAPFDPALKNQGHGPMSPMSPCA